MAIQRSFIYKVYRAGTYLGDLDPIVSEFSYSQDINTAGSQITVVVGKSADTSGLAPDILTDEDTTTLTDEDGVELTDDRQDDIVGDDNDQILMRNGNKLKVWMFDDYNPNGKLMFSGDIEVWDAGFGDDTGTDQITLTVYSDGQDLNNYIIPGTNANFQDQVNTTYLAGNAWAATTNYGGATQWPAQTFVTGSGVTNISAVKLRLIGLSTVGPGTVGVTLALYRSISDVLSMAAPLASTALTIPTDVPPTPPEAFYTFTFSSPVVVTPSTAYCWVVYPTTPTTTESATVVFSNVDSYPAGDGYLLNGVGSYPTTASQTPVSGGGAISDFYFVTYSSLFTTQATFGTQDPATMLKSIMDTYVSQGGLISYQPATIDPTGLSVPYTFSLATVYEGIQVAAKLAPFDWYWYVDVGSDLLYFKERASTPDFVLQKGVHLADVNIVATTENVKNFLYFSGGDLGLGVNLFKTYHDADSIQKYGLRIDRQSDNRVILDSTADALGDAFIAANKDQQYRSVVVVSAATMDITLLKPGKTIGFSGFGTFIDRLVIQIVRVDYEPERATLTLGALPPRVNTTLEQALADINAIQTIANPDIPS